MSADIVVFHSSEADDPALLVEGWYVGTIEGDVLTTEDARGPYETKQDAARAMTKGVWI